VYIEGIGTLYVIVVSCRNIILSTNEHWARYLIVVPGRISSQSGCLVRVLRLYSRRGLAVHSADEQKELTLPASSAQRQGNPWALVSFRRRLGGKGRTALRDAR
jgi:hypothetical protein